MARCPCCDYPLPDDRERVGARCPRCRDPLYEPATRIARAARAGEPSCPVHAAVESVSQCSRCGEHLCEVCRTRWRGQILCSACVDRALQTHEATPDQQRSVVRQARLALLLGGGAWLLSAVALGVLRLVGNQAPVFLTFAVCLVLLGNVLVAALGVGQGITALRTPGERRRSGEAAAGLLLGGVYAGLMLGLGTLFVWQN
jgi:hypothetical protein